MTITIALDEPMSDDASLGICDNASTTLMESNIFDHAFGEAARMYAQVDATHEPALSGTGINSTHTTSSIGLHSATKTTAHAKASSTAGSISKKQRKNLLIRCPFTPCIADKILYIGPHLKSHGITDPDTIERYSKLGNYICPDCRIEFFFHHSHGKLPPVRCYEHYKTCTGTSVRRETAGQALFTSPASTQFALAPSRDMLTTVSIPEISLNTPQEPSAPLPNYSRSHHLKPGSSLLQPFGSTYFDFLKQGADEAKREFEAAIGPPDRTAGVGSSWVPSDQLLEPKPECWNQPSVD